VLALLTQQKQAADLLRGQIIPAKGVGTKFDAGGLNKPQGAGGSTFDTSPAPPAQSSKGSNVLVNPGVSMAPEVDPLACARAYPAPLIFSINSKKTGVVFTTDPATNYFVLRGCNFGNTKGSVYLMGGFKAGPIPFAIESWDDTWIIGKVKPDLSGEWDQDSVSLRIAKPNAQSYDFQGYSFYAAREQQFVGRFYKEQIQLGAPCDLQNKSCSYVSPGPSPGVGSIPCWPGFCTPPAGPTISVSRTSFSAQSFGQGGTDSYVLNGLAPGFVIGTVELVTFSDKHQGWSANVSDNRLDVNFFFGHRGDQYDASYLMGVYLSGPRGCQPF